MSLAKAGPFTCVAVVALLSCEIDQSSCMATEVVSTNIGTSSPLPPGTRSFVARIELAHPIDTYATPEAVAFDSTADEELAAEYRQVSPTTMEITVSDLQDGHAYRIRVHGVRDARPRACGFSGTAETIEVAATSSTT